MMKNLLSIIAHLSLLMMNFVTSLLRPAGYGGQDWSIITPLFLKEKGGAGERENFFSREKKFFPSSQERIHFNRIAGRYCDDSHSGGDIAPCIEQCP